ncbi:GNAT family N-acetyltransferase [Olsenella sp. Marseille-P4559]|uniref:GNAT family N-acetyltransferase n=1 Tax=Olsenella sp. Marseille-P4559 TaxID=2364795 RepID=UPI0010313811|nr:GNAT family N-acetyltransferase [Olsenella sp. Marseille-P4559]
MVREAAKDDLYELLNLYLYLHGDGIPSNSRHLEATWNAIVEDANHHIIVNEVDGKIVSSCVCVIVPNLTRDVRPYALIENVVTNKEHRGKGFASECLDYAKDVAIQNRCYKMMLLTGAKSESTLDFYRNAGYNSGDKTAFAQWLE